MSFTERLTESEWRNFKKKEPSDKSPSGKKVKLKVVRGGLSVTPQQGLP